jgi:hypothetical protein
VWSGPSYSVPQLLHGSRNLTTGHPPIDKPDPCPSSSSSHRILQWNCDGLAEVGQVPKMLRMIEKQRPDYVGLSETWAKQNALNSAQDYNIFSSTSSQTGGVVLLVKSVFRPAHLASIFMAGGQAVLATVHGGIIGAVYAPPRASVKDLRAFIGRPTTYPGTIVLAGDWNARAAEWNDKPSPRGHCLLNSRRIQMHAKLSQTFQSSRCESSTIYLVATTGCVTVSGVPELPTTGTISQYGNHPVITRLQ